MTPETRGRYRPFLIPTIDTTFPDDNDRKHVRKAMDEDELAGFKSKEGKADRLIAAEALKGR